MTRYANSTKVSVERSQNELLAVLKKHGATSYAIGADSTVARVMFEVEGRRIRFELKVPTYADFGGEMPDGIRRLGPDHREKWCRDQAEQSERQRWRALILVIKAKFELVAEGVGSIESEFMANVVLPNGNLVGEWLAPQLAAAYSNGKMPPLLPGGKK